MSIYLLTDIGSTFTKVTLVDLNNEKVINTASSFTTVETDVNIGFNNAISALEEKLGKKVTYNKIFACSSASGGLKMAAIGLVSELTTEAAKRVCLGSGAKVELVFSGVLTNSEVEKLSTNDIDIILLAGGIDGGDTDTVIANSEILSKLDLNIPIVFAGNKEASDIVKENFLKMGKEFYIAENVMPKLNKLNVDSAKDFIRQIFIEKIVYSKGINTFQDKLDGPIIPTPSAVLHALDILSTGHNGEVGLDDIVIVDVGGATTDIYSSGFGYPKSINTVLAGLEEPFLKRTVEGDLGMRYSAMGILKDLSNFEKHEINKSFDIEKELTKRNNDVSFISKTDKDYEVDEYLAYKCTNIAFSRHVGKIKETFTHQGVYYYQTGKDLRDVKYLIGTGGIIINSKNPENILNGARGDVKLPEELRPLNPQILIDKNYILSAMGLLSLVKPEKALKILKKELLGE